MLPAFSLLAPCQPDVSTPQKGNFFSRRPLRLTRVRGVPLAGAAPGLGELVGGHQACKGVATPDSYPPVFIGESRRREVAPHVGLYVVLRDTATGVVHDPKIELRVGIALLSASSEFSHLCGCLPVHQSTRRQRD